MLLLRAHRLLRLGSLSVASSQEEVRFWGAAPIMVALYFGSILRLCACTSVMRTYVPCVIFFQHTPVDLTLRQANTLCHCELFKLFKNILAFLLAFASFAFAKNTGCNVITISLACRVGCNHSCNCASHRANESSHQCVVLSGSLFVRRPMFAYSN